jgi:hypothetical protein
MPANLESLLSPHVPPSLAREVNKAHTELKENFYHGRFRPSELEGGRFAEAAIRVVQQLATSTHDPLGRSLQRFDAIITALGKLPASAAHESLRIHIPRALWTVYGVRNRRDVGHIGGDVNPNRADAHLVAAVCDWVLAELIRLTFDCPLPQAQTIVDNLVERKLPLIQEFDGFPKILRTDLSIPDRVLAVAYVRGTGGVDAKDLERWLKPAKRSAVMIALLRLDRDKAYIHRAGERCLITQSGIRYVEEKIGFVFTP